MTDREVAPDTGEVGVPDDLYGVRGLLREIKALRDERDQVKALKQRVVADYDAHVEHLEKRESQIRLAVRNYCERHGKAVVPDVGTAYVTTVKPNLDVQDQASFREWCEKNGHTKTVPDTTAGRKAAVEAGEEPPGTTFVAEHLTLGVRFK